FSALYIWLASAHRGRYVRYLHSFPTRRSSDLVVQASADTAEPGQRMCVTGGEEASVGIGASGPHLGPRLDDRCRQPLFCSIHGNRDTDCARSDDNEIVASLTHRWESPCWCSPIDPFRNI